MLNSVLNSLICKFRVQRLFNLRCWRAAFCTAAPETVYRFPSRRDRHVASLVVKTVEDSTVVSVTQVESQLALQLAPEALQEPVISVMVLHAL